MSFEREQRRELLKRLEKASVLRRREYPELEEPRRVKLARRIVERFDEKAYNVQRRHREKIERATFRIRSDILFKSIEKALRAVERFEGGK